MSPYDAVNVRQLRGVYSGVAGAAAMANIPPVDPGKKFALGAGIGGFTRFGRAMPEIRRFMEFLALILHEVVPRPPGTPAEK